jgi:hypothetical protein
MSWRSALAQAFESPEALPLSPVRTRRRKRSKNGARADHGAATANGRPPSPPDRAGRAPGPPGPRQAS